MVPGLFAIARRTNEVSCLMLGGFGLLSFGRSEGERLNEENRKKRTYYIRRIRKIISPELVTCCFFSILRALIVPRFRCEYTDFERPKTESDFERKCRCTEKKGVCESEQCRRWERLRDVTYSFRHSLS